MRAWIRRGICNCIYLSFDKPYKTFGSYYTADFNAQLPRRYENTKKYSSLPKNGEPVEVDIEINFK